MIRRSLRLAVAGLCVVALAAPSAAQVESGPVDWPQWRGPRRDGVSDEKGLLKQWPEDGPPLLWQVDHVGVGYSSVAVQGDRLYTMGDLEGIEHVICLDARDGSTIWAVQPEPVAKRLNERVAAELRKLDRDSDGRVDELEALQGLGWEFHKYDRDVEDGEGRKPARAAALFKAIDVDSDGRWTFDEAGRLLRDEFSRMDRSDENADAEQLAQSRTAELMKQLDTNGDDRLSREEIRNSSVDRVRQRADRPETDSQRGDGELTPDELTGFFATGEPGRDGTISLDELSDYYSRNGSSGDGMLTEEELAGRFGGLRDGQGDGPRGTPTLDGDRVYTEGGNGDVACLSAMTGQTVWHVQLVDDLGGNRPGWGYSESPLVAGDLLIVTPGGRQGTIAALDKLTGAVVWRSQSLTEGAHYSSPVSATIGGVRQFVQFASSNVFGVDAADGSLLWTYGGANNGTANCCTPIVYEDHVFVASGYGTGGGLARIESDGVGEPSNVRSQKASEVYFEKKMAIHHGGIVKVGDHLYSNGAGSLISMDFLTGNIAWQARGVGKGSLIAADDMLYVLSERHEVALVEATPVEYRERGRFKIPSHGRPSWAHPVVARGKLFLRDQQSLSAYDVKM